MLRPDGTEHRGFLSRQNTRPITNNAVIFEPTDRSQQTQSQGIAMSHTASDNQEKSMNEERWTDSKGRRFHAERPFERHDQTYRRLHVTLPANDESFKVYQVWQPERGPLRPAGWYKTAGALADEAGGTVFSTVPCPECGNTADPESSTEFGAVRAEKGETEPWGFRYICSKCEALLSNEWMELDYLPPNSEETS